jgi:hypothetical protein
MTLAPKLTAVEQAAERAPEFRERHYSPAQIAELWSLSLDTVRKIFEKEPGVLLIEGSVGRYRKRRYRTLRIPENVVERVHRRLRKI